MAAVQHLLGREAARPPRGEREGAVVGAPAAHGLGELEARELAVALAVELHVLGPEAAARKVSGWPKRRELAHTFRWEYSYEVLKLAQLLGQLGVFLTFAISGLRSSVSLAAQSVSFSSCSTPSCVVARTTGSKIPAAGADLDAIGCAPHSERTRHSASGS